MSPVFICGYLALFVGVGIAFLFFNLLIGWFFRPKAPNTEKLEVYECGEPTIGSSFVQFDLRFYVIALLFIIFDVEVAFFFPWAAVFGKATQLSDPRVEVAVADETQSLQLTPAAAQAMRELGVTTPTLPYANGEVAQNTQAVREMVDTLALTSIIDILVFFAVLMMGFAYVWRRGDLDWVRAVSRQRSEPPSPGKRAEEPALIA